MWSKCEGLAARKAEKGGKDMKIPFSAYKADLSVLLASRKEQEKVREKPSITQVLSFFFKPNKWSPKGYPGENYDITMEFWSNI